jgi:hypothetical protein
MRNVTCLGRWLAASFLLSLLALGTAMAQAPDEVDGVDNDFGMKLRHPAAYRGDLNVPWGGGTREVVGVGWTYHFFDHPKPSFQYFQQPQVIKWPLGSFSGVGGSLYDYGGPPVYYPPYGYYNSPYNYCPPRPRSRYGGCRYGW